MMSLSRVLFLLLLILPLIEIYFLIQVGGLIGAIPTIALVVFTAVLGVLLLQQQGLAAFRRVQLLVQQGEAPTAAMLEASVILLSGFLLLLPGLLTDVFGLLGLIPPLRRILVMSLLRQGLPQRPVPKAGPTSRLRRGPTTLEGEYRKEDD